MALITSWMKLLFVLVLIGLADKATSQSSGTILTCEEWQCAFGFCIESIDGASNATCDCLLGYEGVFCDTPTNECSSNPCLNGATCVDRVAQYLCVCAPGYDGTNCEEGTFFNFPTSWQHFWDGVMF
ncbi:fibropellin-3-like [Asterias rubens]|uniref:fibropellin-3-like n=1 Tax=Asterias rubens TaxID=7604 RepID=UPI001455872D|nr:fibropellin-3-like [Asterias rubens]